MPLSFPLDVLVDYSATVRTVDTAPGDVVTVTAVVPDTFVFLHGYTVSVPGCDAEFRVTALSCAEKAVVPAGLAFPALPDLARLPQLLGFRQAITLSLLNASPQHAHAEVTLRGVALRPEIARRFLDGVAGGDFAAAVALLRNARVTWGDRPAEGDRVVHLSDGTTFCAPASGEVYARKAWQNDTMACSKRIALLDQGDAILCEGLYVNITSIHVASHAPRCSDCP